MVTYPTVMRSRWRGMIERLLPWYDPAAAARRKAVTERLHRRARLILIDSDRAIADYRRAEAARLR